MRSILILLALVLAASAANSDERVWLGKSRLWTNDEIGDRRDRWRTGSYSTSFIRGKAWDGKLPDSFGALVEYRVRGEVIAPRSLYVATPATDRRLVGVLQIGAFTHMKVRKMDLSMGLDLVFTGPSTGMAQFQSGIHNLLGYPNSAVLGSQLGNAVFPTANFELGREFKLSKPSSRRMVVRPFVEGQFGVENYVRTGADFTFGVAGLGDFLVRDVTSGHRTTAIKSDRKRGVSFLLGGDVAWVQSSKYLPVALGPAVKNIRSRLRAGIYVEERGKSLFYGLTWLSPEFVGQPASQIVGSLSLRLKF